MKPCQHTGCRELITNGTHCRHHQPQATAHAAEQAIRKERRYRNTPEAKASKTFLNTKEWKHLRQQKLNANPFCEQCEAEGRTTLTQHIHHKQPRQERPDLALTYDNLESLCIHHHSQRTLKEQRDRMRNGIVQIIASTIDDARKEYGKDR